MQNLVEEVVQEVVVQEVAVGVVHHEQALLEAAAAAVAAVVQGEIGSLTYFQAQNLQAARRRHHHHRVQVVLATIPNNLHIIHRIHVQQVALIHHHLIVV